MRVRVTGPQVGQVDARAVALACVGGDEAAHLVSVRGGLELLIIKKSRLID
jgi:hypothetical protein